MKRCFDICLALVGTVLFSPILILLAVLVKLSSRGPIFFCQTRVGRGGKDFVLFKFRTMTVKSESENGEFEPGNLQRVTGIGRLLRATKLDELPQLLNVLLGDMSLVGPRPEVRCWVDTFPDQWQFVHTVRPGITDPASILYRNEEKILALSEDPERTYREDILPRKLHLYVDYVHRQSFWYDLKLLFETVLAVFSFRGSVSSANPSSASST